MNDPMQPGPTGPDPLAAIGALFPLLGTWRGRGRGRYPTIPSFEYVEELCLTANGSQPLIHYVQKTWKRDEDGGAGLPLHSESGFWRATPEGVFEISNAQDGGRVEVLRGRIAADGRDGRPFELRFESVVLAHDARMLRTRRSYVLGEGVLRTSVEMATVRTPELQPHLDAVLTKSW